MCSGYQSIPWIIFVRLRLKPAGRDYFRSLPGRSRISGNATFHVCDRQGKGLGPPKGNYFGSNTCDAEARSMNLIETAKPEKSPQFINSERPHSTMRNCHRVVGLPSFPHTTKRCYKLWGRKSRENDEGWLDECSIVDNM